MSVEWLYQHVRNTALYPTELPVDSFIFAVGIKFAQ